MCKRLRTTHAAEMTVTFALRHGVKNGLLERPELFVRTLSEKLFTFALGRGVEAYDAPAIRQIVSDAEADELVDIDN